MFSQILCYVKQSIYCLQKQICVLKEQVANIYNSISVINEEIINIINNPQPTPFISTNDPSLVTVYPSADMPAEAISYYYEYDLVNNRAWVNICFAYTPQATPESSPDPSVYRELGKIQIPEFSGKIIKNGGEETRGYCIETVDGFMRTFIVKVDSNGILSYRVYCTVPPFSYPYNEPLITYEGCVNNILIEFE